MTSVTKVKTKVVAESEIWDDRLTNATVALTQAKRWFAACHERQKGSTSKGIDVDVGRQSVQSKLYVLPKFIYFLPFCETSLVKIPKCVAKLKDVPFFLLFCCSPSSTSLAQMNPSFDRHKYPPQGVDCLSLRQVGSIWQTDSTTG